MRFNCHSFGFNAENQIILGTVLLTGKLVWHSLQFLVGRFPATGTAERNLDSIPPDLVQVHRQKSVILYGYLPCGTDEYLSKIQFLMIDMSTESWKTHSHDKCMWLSIKPCPGQHWPWTLSSVPDSAELDSALFWTVLSLTQLCSGQRWAWLSSVLDSAELDSALFWTVLSLTQLCNGQRWAWLSSVLDSTNSA